MTDVNSPPVPAADEGDNPPPVIPHRPIAGNTADDDGLAIDAFFEGMNAGPQIYSQPIPKREDLPMVTRTLTARIDLANYSAGQSVLVFPADPRRQHMHIESVSGTTSQVIASALNETVNVTTVSPGETFSWTLAMAAADAAGNFALNIGGNIVGAYSAATLNTFTGTYTNTTSADQAVTLQATGATAEASLVGTLSTDAAPYAWSSEPIGVASMVPLLLPTDFDQHTGPIYVCKTTDADTILSIWVTTL